MSLYNFNYDQAARKWEEEPEYDEDQWEDYDGPYPEGYTKEDHMNGL